MLSSVGDLARGDAAVYTSQCCYGCLSEQVCLTMLLPQAALETLALQSQLVVGFRVLSVFVRLRAQSVPLDGQHAAESALHCSCMLRRLPEVNNRLSCSSQPRYDGSPNSRLKPRTTSPIMKATLDCRASCEPSTLNPKPVKLHQVQEHHQRKPYEEGEHDAVDDVPPATCHV